MGRHVHEDLQHRGGVRLGDYTGLPLNEAGWRKAQSWDEDARSTSERQCIPHVVTYALRGPATIRFIKIIDPVSGELQAYNLQGSYGRPRIIWMDGREHPSDLAPHTWGGFSTGTWERNTLVVATTHIKTGWLLRNGAPTSDLATMREYFTRYGDYLMVATIVNDPVYLDEPFIRTTNFVLSLTTNANAWGNCAPQQITDELGGRPKGCGAALPARRDGPHSGIPDQERCSRGGGARRSGDHLSRIHGQVEKNGNLDNRIFPAHRAGQEFRPRSVAPDKRNKPWRNVTKSYCRSKETCTCSPARAATWRCRWAKTASCWWTRERQVSPTRSSLRSEDLSNKPIRFIINTNADPDHMGGNERLAAAWKSAAEAGPVTVRGPGAMVIAHEAVLTAVSAPTGQAVS